VNEQWLSVPLLQPGCDGVWATFHVALSLLSLLLRQRFLHASPVATAFDAALMLSVVRTCNL